MTATLVLLAVVGLVLLIGWLRNDPGRSPPPAGYPPAACAAFRELTAATDAFAAGDLAAVSADISRADGSVASLPAWEPGRDFEALLASLLVTLLDATTAGPSDARLEVAQNLVANGRTMLAERRYGFDCGVSSGSP
ncbi:MAG: hypothetical protein M3R49_01220 [Chloroflexota bacterium]|nr:hypothetical protein [Chloroflexota bacterium]